MVDQGIGTLPEFAAVRPAVHGLVFGTTLKLLERHSMLAPSATSRPRQHIIGKSCTPRNNNFLVHRMVSQQSLYRLSIRGP